MRTVGYARVSTDHQSLDAQRDALERAGCVGVFTDQLSGVREDRPGLAGLLDYVRDGDVVGRVAGPARPLAERGDPYDGDPRRCRRAVAVAARGHRLLDADRPDAGGDLRCAGRLRAGANARAGRGSAGGRPSSRPAHWPAAAAHAGPGPAGAQAPRWRRVDRGARRRVQVSRATVYRALADELGIDSQAAAPASA